MLMVNQLVGFGAGGSVAHPTTYQFCGVVNDLPANKNPQSQVLAFGDAPTGSQTRHLIVGVAFVTASGVAPDSVTVAGTPATLVVVHAPTGVFTAGQGIWIVEMPTGTSGTIEVSVPSSDIDGGAIVVWAAYNLHSATAVATAAAIASSAPTDISVDTQDGGAVFALTSISSTVSRSVDWTGVTEDSADETVNNQVWSASAFDTSAETPRSVTALWLNGSDDFGPAAVAASFR